MAYASPFCNFTMCWSYLRKDISENVYIINPKEMAFCRIISGRGGRLGRDDAIAIAHDTHIANKQQRDKT